MRDLPKASPTTQQTIAAKIDCLRAPVAGGNLPTTTFRSWVACALPRLMVLAISVAACTPIRHHLEPYRDDPEAARTLEERAAHMCIRHRGPADQPPHHFTTDGCSMWPNGTWTQCCVEHDIAYWCGGSAEDREQADRALRQCVSENRSACFGTMMYVGVRAGGVPWQPFPWRWAYGWNDIHGYDHPSAGSR